MNYYINLKNPDLQITPQPIKPKQKFLSQFLDKLRQEEKTGQVYRSIDTSAFAISTAG